MRWLPALVAAVAGSLCLVLLLPRFDAALPWGLAITRAEAERIADAEARRLGIEVDQAWKTTTWSGSLILEDSLKKDPARRRAAAGDPVLGPRLGSYLVTYFRHGLEKWPAYGQILVGRTGEVLGAIRSARNEEPGGKPKAVELQPRADAFVASRRFPGAPTPRFESARPDVHVSRTDHTFRYVVDHPAAPASVRLLLLVTFTGDRFDGWWLQEELADGSSFRYEMSGNLAAIFVRFGALVFVPFVLGAIFLKKYHAGEVGVATGALLFFVMMAASVAHGVSMAAPAGFSTGLGGTDARVTALANAALVILFYDLPLAILVFAGWAVGESYARERWGERLAAFDAILRRDPLNATVGRALLHGLLASPVVAAAALAPALPLLYAGRAWLHPISGPFSGASEALVSSWGPATVIVGALLSTLPVAVVAVLFALAATRRIGPYAGFALLAVLGMCLGSGAPIEPAGWQLLLACGGPIAAGAVFLAWDLLAAAVALFSASLLSGLLPLLRCLEGAAWSGAMASLASPLLLLAIAGAAGMATRRTVEYRYDDLAPHVRRIVERERVKAEIDAANRIQAALLPPEDPKLPGALVASHYRAATEIGGDYFDFLKLPDGRIGLAFGDVAGHGLTSGIVMAMAKAALLVQVAHEPSPRRVLEVLNDIVIRTAPRRITMTFFFGALDPASGELTFCSAGHLDPYVLRADDGRLEALSAWGYPLGVRRREPFEEHVVTLAPGDRLVLYSDGLIEAFDDAGEPFGFDRFEDTLRAAAEKPVDEVRGTLLAAVKRFTRNRPPDDDQTLVVLSLERQA